jgi:hypothetical protein
MVTRFTASEARLKAETARKKLENQRKRNEELKRSLTRERAHIKRKIELQKVEIISAAIDGKNEVTVDSIYLFRDLIDVGIKVIEKTQRARKVFLFSQKAIQINEEIINLLKKFMNDSKHKLIKYYGGGKEFHIACYDVLYDAINSDWQWNWTEFDGDAFYSEKVPYDLRSKYINYIEKINEKIDQYKAFDADLDFEEEPYNDEQLICDEYIFGKEDVEVDLLMPSGENSLLQIRWSTESNSTFMNDPLLSDVGLAWLSTYRGQNLIDAIFDSLNSAAEIGKTNLDLIFSLDKDGWSFNAGTSKVFCCMPNEIVYIIGSKNFTIDDTSSAQKSYSIKVSW